MKFTRRILLSSFILMVWVLLSTLPTILFVVPLAHGQETQTVLKPHHLVTFSLAPKQEKLFVLQMKKGDIAEISSAGEQAGVFLYLSFEIYDSARKELLDKSDALESFLFVAPRDGDFLLVSKLYSGTSSAEEKSIQYNNKFELPSEVELNGMRKVHGFDVRIIGIPGHYDVLLIEKNGQLQKIRKANGSSGFSFVDEFTEADSAKVKRSVQLIETTVDKTGDGIPDVMIYDTDCGASGRSCSTATSFIDLGDTVKISESIDAAANSGGLLAIGNNPKGGLFFKLRHQVYGSPLVILEFKNGVLRPNFDLMKKPAPPLVVLRSKARKFRNQLSLKPYKGIDVGDSVLYKQTTFVAIGDDGKQVEDVDPVLVEERPQNGFEDVMSDLIFTGNEKLAWQFLDLVWPPQKQGKEIFIRDFKNLLLQSQYWQMILEDRKK